MKLYMIKLKKLYTYIIMYSRESILCVLVLALIKCTQSCTGHKVYLRLKQKIVTGNELNVLFIKFCFFISIM